MSNTRQGVWAQQWFSSNCTFLVVIHLQLDRGRASVERSPEVRLITARDNRRACVERAAINLNEIQTHAVC